MGELFVLSQAKASHKQFISAMVRHRMGVTLPLELDFIYGMRRYQVLFTGERGMLPVYHRDVGRFILM